MPDGNHIYAFSYLIIIYAVRMLLYFRKSNIIWQNTPIEIPITVIILAFLCGFFNSRSGKKAISTYCIYHFCEF